MQNNLVLYIQVNIKLEIQTNQFAILIFLLHVKMGKIADGKELSGDPSTWPPLPQVRVTYNGEVKETAKP